MKKYITFFLLATICFSSIPTYLGYQGDQQPDRSVDLYQDFFVQDIVQRGVYQESFLRKLGPYTLMLMHEYIGKEDVCIRAYQLYPHQTETLLQEFGHLSLLATVLEEYGSRKVIPLLWDSFNEDSIWYRLDEQIDRTLDTYLNSESLAGIPEPIRRVMKRLIQIHTLGESYLARFVVNEDGQVEILGVKTTFSILESVLLGGIETVEEKLRLGSTVTLRDWGNAAIDVVTLIPLTWWMKGGKGVRVATGTVHMQKTGRVMTLTSLLPRVVVTKAVKYGVLGTALYLVVKHPGAVNHFLGVIARALGWNAHLVRFLFWFFLSAMVFSMIRFLWRPFLLMLALLRHTLLTFHTWLNKAKLDCF